MTQKRDKSKEPKKEYLEKAKDLSKRDSERLMARMRGRYIRRFEDRDYSKAEALALQLEFEDDQLKDWRKNIAKIREKRKA